MICVQMFEDGFSLKPLETPRANSNGTSQNDFVWFIEHTLDVQYVHECEYGRPTKAAISQLCQLDLPQNGNGQ